MSAATKRFQTLRWGARFKHAASVMYSYAQHAREMLLLAVESSCSKSGEVLDRLAGLRARGRRNPGSVGLFIKIGAPPSFWRLSMV